MSTSTIVISLALPVLLAGAAFCAAAETALFSLTYHDRMRLRRESPRAAEAVERLLRSPRELLISLLFVGMMNATVYFVLTSIVILDAGHPAIAVAISVVNLVVMTVLAEVVAKMLAARRRVEFCHGFARWVAALVRGLGPLRGFLNAGVVAPLARLFEPRDGEDPGVTTGELSSLVSLGEEEGAIDSDEQRVLRQVIHLGTLRVREVMTHRVDMDWLDQAAGPEQVAELVRRTRLTRIPVCRESMDQQVLGMLDAKAYLVQLAKGQMPRLVDHLRKVFYAPDRASLDKVLEQLRLGGTKVALCVDEYGGVTGIISAADVVKRLLAELTATQEGETIGQPDDGSAAKIETLGDGEWLVPGRVRARDWAEMFGLRADPRVSTVAGLIFARLGRLPVVGDKVRLGNVQMRVESLAGRVVDRVRVSLLSERRSKRRKEGA